MKKLIFLILTLFSIFLARGFYFFTYSSGNTSEKIVIEVTPGMNINQVIHRLKAQKFIPSIFEFKVFARLAHPNSHLKTGEYELNRALNPGQILNILSSGKSITRSITFPEGFNMYEMADLLEKKGFMKKSEFLQLCRDRLFIQKLLGKNFKSLEGYLFPDTYQLTKYEKPKKIIKLLVDRFLKTYAELQKNVDVQQHLGILPDRHSIVTLASIIEKETGAAHERPIISSVFHNRLKKKMRLQTDPTVIYGILHETGVFTKNIRRKDLKSPNSYNTYTFRGLPIGPIANPGYKSLKAVLAPDSTEYFYFVSKNQGTHVFTKTYKEHSKAVRKFQLNRKARAGKSWRDLNK